MRSLKDLIVWQIAIELTVEIYRITGAFPHEETYGLTSQMRRAAVSIPSNIAEGYGRRAARERCHFYDIARGSATELSTQLEISKRVGYLAPEQQTMIETSLHDIIRLLAGLYSHCINQAESEEK
jgi:four helix bundle protein